MRISNIKGVKKYSVKGKSGLYYSSKHQELDLEAYVNQRIEEANENTKKFYSIFSTGIKLEWQVYVDNVLLRGATLTREFSIIPKEQIESSLRKQYVPYLDTITDILQGTYDKNKGLEDSIQQGIEKIVKKRESSRLVKSIENQIIDIQIKDGKIQLSPTRVNECWNEFFEKVAQTSASQEVLTIFGMLDQRLFEGLQDGTYEQLYFILKKRVMLAREQSSFYDQYWISIVFSVFSKKYKRKGAQILFVKEIRSYTFGVIRNRIFHKIVGLGKVVFHFTDAQGNLLAKEHDLNHFYFERIRANDALNEAHAPAVMFMALNFGKNLIGEGNDYLGRDIPEQDKEVFYNNFVGYFGGKEFFESNYITSTDTISYEGKELSVLDYARKVNFFLDFSNMIYSFRNYTFHYEKLDFKPEEIDLTFIQYLIKSEERLEPIHIKSEYQDIRVQDYFNDLDLKSLLERIHNQTFQDVLFLMPSYSEIKPYLSESFYDIQLYTPKNTVCDELLHKVYHYSFTRYVEEVFIDLDLLERYKKQLYVEGKENQYQDFINKIKGMKMPEMISFITEENQVGGFRNVMDHTKHSFEMIFVNQMIALLFMDYVKLQFPELLALEMVDHPADLSKITLDLPNLEGKYDQLFSGDIHLNGLACFAYLAGKFIPNKQAGELVIGYQKYARYIHDIERRAKSFGCQMPYVPVLSDEFCRSMILMLRLGVMSTNQALDTYCGDDYCKKEFEKALDPFLEYGVDAEHLFQLMGNVPRRVLSESHKFGVMNKIIPAISPEDKITAKEIKALQDRYGEKESENQKEYLELFNKLKLTNLQKAGELIISLHGVLNGFCLHWERDTEYFLNGLGYLYQVSLADIKLLFIYDGNASGVKIKQFLQKQPKFVLDMKNFKLRGFLMQPSQDPNIPAQDVIVSARNFVDHWSYFRTQEHSIIELYSIYYAMFSYDKKMRTSNLAKFLHILERYGMIVEQKEDNLFSFALNPDTEYDRVGFKAGLLKPKNPDEVEDIKGLEQFISIVEKIILMK